jgi:hypothetical protein
MKTLCLLVMLANIFLLFWEYRSGAFTTPKEQPAQHDIAGKERIFLVHELKQVPPPMSPKIDQETRASEQIPDSRIKEMQDNIDHVKPTISQQPDSSPTQLP